jgi:hypothetical protein
MDIRTKAVFKTGVNASKENVFGVGDAFEVGILLGVGEI